MSHGKQSLAANCAVYAIPAQSADDAEVVSVWIPATNAVRVWVILNPGAMDIAVNAKIEQATAVGGTGKKDLAVSAVTAWDATTGDNDHKSIDFDPERLDHANGFNHFRVNLTVGNGSTGAIVGAVILVWVRHAPPTQPDAYTEAIEVAG